MTATKLSAVRQSLAQIRTQWMSASVAILVIAVCSTAVAMCLGFFPVTALILAVLLCYVIACKVFSARFVTLAAIVAGTAFLLRRFDIRFGVTCLDTEFRLSFFIVLAGCLALLARAIMRRTLRIGSDMLLPFVALIIASLLSITAGSVSGTGRATPAGQLGEMAKFLVPVVFCFAIAWGGLSREDIRRLLRIIVMTAVATALMVVVVSIFSDWFVKTFGWKHVWYGNESIARAHVPLSGGIQSGAFLVMVFPLCLQMYYGSSKRRDILFFFFSAIVIALGIVFCFSRAILVTAVLTTCGMFLARTERKGKLSRGSRKWIFALLLVAAVTAVVSAVSFERYIARGRRSQSIEYRRKGAEVALTVIRDHPVIGSSFATVYPRQVTGFVPDAHRGGRMAVIFYKGEVSPVDPHNLFLMIAAEMGLFGLAVFSWLIYRIFRNLNNYASSARPSPAEKLIVNGFMWGIFAFLFQSLGASFLMTDLRIAVLFWTFVGVSLAFVNGTSDFFQEADAAVGTER